MINLFTSDEVLFTECRIFWNLLMQSSRLSQEFIGKLISQNFTGFLILKPVYKKRIKYNTVYKYMIILKDS